jgi:LPXTG-motif cell wall-anchored protein
MLERSREMSKKVRVLAVTAFAVVFGLGLSGSALALFPEEPGGDPQAPGGIQMPAIPELGNDEHGPCVRDLLDLPALNSCEDAAGRVIMDLPALNMVGPEAAPKRLPVTGANAGDFAAMGAAALAGGAALVRRVRMAVAS